MKIVLVGNKSDDEANRKVSKEEGKRLAEELGADYAAKNGDGSGKELFFIETSAKVGKNIIGLFNTLAADLTGINTVKDDNVSIFNDKAYAASTTAGAKEGG